MPINATDTTVEYDTWYLLHQNKTTIQMQIKPRLCKKTALFTNY